MTCELLVREGFATAPVRAPSRAGLAPQLGFRTGLLRERALRRLPLRRHRAGSPTLAEFIAISQKRYLPTGQTPGEFQRKRYSLQMTGFRLKGGEVPSLL